MSQGLAMSGSRGSISSAASVGDDASKLLVSEFQQLQGLQTRLQCDKKALEARLEAVTEQLRHAEDQTAFWTERSGRLQQTVDEKNSLLEKYVLGLTMQEESSDMGMKAWEAFKAAASNNSQLQHLHQSLEMKQAEIDVLRAQVSDSAKVHASMVELQQQLDQARGEIMMLKHALQPEKASSGVWSKKYQHMAGLYSKEQTERQREAVTFQAELSKLAHQLRSYRAENERLAAAQHATQHATQLATQYATQHAARQHATPAHDTHGFQQVRQMQQVQQMQQIQQLQKGHGQLSARHGQQQPHSRNSSSEAFTEQRNRSGGLLLRNPSRDGRASANSMFGAQHHR